MVRVVLEKIAVEAMKACSEPSCLASQQRVERLLARSPYAKLVS
jgi:hypothetical protein